MESIKVLFISQEITPYLPETEISVISRNLPQGIQERGKEIRTFMPKYGCINERRNQLHEVIRLSGMNLIIDDTDHPLIIKVASIQSARMQVYFIDNEDYFQRKHLFKDEHEQYYDDNDERAIFFARGVIETVRKLRWAPDIIHCHGWFTGFVPLYLKRSFQDDPLFASSKVIFSIYTNDAHKHSFNDNILTKIKYDGTTEKDISILKTPSYFNLLKLAINFSDGIIKGSKEINPEIEKHIKSAHKKYLDSYSPDDYIDAYSEFYEKILEESDEQ